MPLHFGVFVRSGSGHRLQPAGKFDLQASQIRRHRVLI
jgi:hypothetical protein